MTGARPSRSTRSSDALAANPDVRVVSFVHAETSTGVCSDAEAIAAMAHAHGALVIADTVTSLGGIPVLVDEWGLDAVYSGSQKCLSCTPGLSPVTFGEAALEKVKARKTRCQSWFMDLNLVLPYWEGGARTYHHTAPINPLYGLHESLLMLTEEGLEAAWRRHAELHAALVEGLEGLGLSMFVEAPYRLPQLNLVSVPDGVDDAWVRAEALRATASSSATASACWPARSGASASWARRARRPTWTSASTRWGRWCRRRLRSRSRARRLAAADPAHCSSLERMLAFTYSGLTRGRGDRD